MKSLAYIKQILEDKKKLRERHASRKARGGLQYLARNEELQSKDLDA